MSHKEAMQISRSSCSWSPGRWKEIPAVLTARVGADLHRTGRRRCPRLPTLGAKIPCQDPVPSPGYEVGITSTSARCRFDLMTVLDAGISFILVHIKLSKLENIPHRPVCADPIIQDHRDIEIRARSPFGIWILRQHKPRTNI